MKFIWTDLAEKSFSKINVKDQKRIIKKLEKIQKSDNVMSFLEAYKGDLGNLYKLRVGDYRLINCVILDDCIIYIVSCSHRKKSYSQNSKQAIKSTLLNILKTQEK